MSTALERLRREEELKSLFNLSEIAYPILVCVNALATTLNHIDDTDETFGYWEPLHYLLFGTTGMQTWEYAEQFAIRTYAFILPFLGISTLFKVYFKVQLKISFFLIIRLTLSVMSAYSEKRFVLAIQKLFGITIALNTAMFMILSPGIFICSTAFLPSAVAMSVVMLSISFWMEGMYVFSIAMGCIAVFWTGWPFVGVLFVPLGLHMLVVACCPSEEKNSKTNYSVFSLILYGFITLIFIAGSAAAVDIFMYKKWVSPTLNILVYNALGGNGDELYGTEPMSYYIRNLFLNMSTAWLLFPIFPLWFFYFSFWRESTPFDQTGFRSPFYVALTVSVSACSWLLLLFTRPHKEERFLYPVYPLLAFMAACTLSSIAYLSEQIADSQLSKYPKRSSKKRKKWTIGLAFRIAVLITTYSITALVCVSRIAANYRNYRGYMELWKDTSTVLLESPPHASAAVPATVCTGSEWYLFPSHFYLPRGARLAFVDDGFRGILPQQYSLGRGDPALFSEQETALNVSLRRNGTYLPPLQPFNNENREESSRYVPIGSCDYLVVLVEGNNSTEAAQMKSQLDVIRHSIIASNILSDSISVGVANHSEAISVQIGEEDFKYSIAAVRRVISSEYTTSSLARAYYIPLQQIQKLLGYKYYILLKKLAMS